MTLITYKNCQEIGVGGAQFSIDVTWATYYELVPRLASKLESKRIWQWHIYEKFFLSFTSKPLETGRRLRIVYEITTHWCEDRTTAAKVRANIKIAINGSIYSTNIHVRLTTGKRQGSEPYLECPPTKRTPTHPTSYRMFSLNDVCREIKEVQVVY